MCKKVKKFPNSQPHRVVLEKNLVFCISTMWMAYVTQDFQQRLLRVSGIQLDTTLSLSPKQIFFNNCGIRLSSLLNLNDHDVLIDVLKSAVLINYLMLRLAPEPC